ncbi:hypothetical protein HDE_03147 [Halotydeus destructor]|nr:hypothetical protein HDE_03147 [Halotydeus destructor]
MSINNESVASNKKPDTCHASNNGGRSRSESVADITSALKRQQFDASQDRTVCAKWSLSSGPESTVSKKAEPSTRANSGGSSSGTESSNAAPYHRRLRGLFTRSASSASPPPSPVNCSSCSSTSPRPLSSVSMLHNESSDTKCEHSSSPEPSSNCGELLLLEDSVESAQCSIDFSSRTRGTLNKRCFSLDESATSKKDIKPTSVSTRSLSSRLTSSKNVPIHIIVEDFDSVG